MTETLKILGQSAPGATTLTQLYKVPAATTVTISSLVVCNTGAATTTFRFYVGPTASASAPVGEAIYYDVAIPANDTFICTAGLTGIAATYFTCYATLATLTFTLFGVETT